MVTDLPDYEKKIIIVTPPGEYPAIVQVDLRKILGEDLITPTVAGCVPTSIENEAIAYDAINDWFKTYIENDAIAYDSDNDRFKVDVEAMTVGTLTTTTDLIKVLGAALSHANPVIVRLTSGTAFIDPRDRNWTITEALARSWNLGSSDVPDLSDRAARLLGKVYGSQAQVLAQRAATYELLVQLRSGGAEIDPTQIRALTSSDVVTAVQATRTSLKAQTEREDLTSLGGVASPNNAGVQIIAPDGTKKVKVYDAGYHAGADGLHYFYFGTTTTATTRRFCTMNKALPVHKTFVQPRVSNAGDGLYIYSAVSETNMPYDVGYVQE